MCHDEHGFFHLGQVADHGLHLSYHRRIKSARRLVKQYDLRIHGKCPCDGSALLLAAGQLIRVIIFLIRQSYTPQQFYPGLIGLLLWSFQNVHLCLHNVFYHVQVAKQIKRLKYHAHPAMHLCHIISRRADVLSVQDDPASRRALQHIDTAQQGRFAGAGRSDDRDDIAVIYDSVHVGQRRNVSVFFFKMHQFNHLFSSSFLSSLPDLRPGIVRISILFTIHISKAARRK